MRERLPKGDKPRYPYPFIECHGHKGAQRSYIVCPHILDKSATPFLVRLASNEAPGQVLCLGCSEALKRGEEPDMDKLTCVCEGCAIDEGFLMAV